jgi:protein-S-isoprenylcysteine O-methyltransferase Ste14
MFISIFGAAILFAYVFQWFPTGSWEAWFGFIVSYSVCVVLSILFMLVMLRMENKKLKQQLSDYKEKQHQERGGSDD